MKPAICKLLFRFTVVALCLATATTDRALIAHDTRSIEKSLTAIKTITVEEKIGGATSRKVDAGNGGNTHASLETRAGTLQSIAAGEIGIVPLTGMFMCFRLKFDHDSIAGLPRTITEG